MTKEEAINIIKSECYVFNPLNFDGSSRINLALDMAIQALEQEPCEDAISRQIISDYVESHIQEINTGYGDLNKHTNEILRMIVDYIESMPPVTPQPKTGHWIEHNHNGIGHIECSECHSWFLMLRLLRNSYCPNCGAEMEGEEESK